MWRGERGWGAGDKIVTPWFIVLHQIFVYSPNLVPLSFSFFLWEGVADAIMAASSAKSLQGLIQIN